MHTVFTGDLVRLRPFESPEEYSSLFAVVNLSDAGFWGHAWFSEKALQDRFAKDGCLAASGAGRFAVERLDTAELVGFEFYWLDGLGHIYASIGTEIVQEHRRQGFGREAKLLAMCFLFENFPIECIQSNTHYKHAKAIAGLEACNMTLEGTNRCTWLTNGEYSDVVCYRMFRGDWEAMEYRHRVKRG